MHNINRVGENSKPLPRDDSQAGEKGAGGPSPVHTVFLPSRLKTLTVPVLSIWALGASVVLLTLALPKVLLMVTRNLDSGLLLELVTLLSWASAGEGRLPSLLAILLGEAETDLFSLTGAMGMATLLLPRRWAVAAAAGSGWASELVALARTVTPGGLGRSCWGLADLQNFFSTPAYCKTELLLLLPSSSLSGALSSASCMSPNRLNTPVGCQESRGHQL